jgi:hypothetical protein
MEIKRIESETAIFNQLVENVKAALTETSFSIRDMVIKCNWEIGTMIIEAHARILGSGVKSNIDDLLENLSACLGKSKRSLYYSIAFARAYESLDALPEKYKAKNVSFSMIKKELLSDTPEAKVSSALPLEAQVCICPKCGKKHTA